MNHTETIIAANVLFFVGSIVLLWSIWRWLQRRNYKRWPKSPY